MVAARPLLADADVDGALVEGAEVSPPYCVVADLPGDGDLEKEITFTLLL